MNPFVVLFTVQGEDILQVQAMIADSVEDSILGFCEGKTEEDLEKIMINAVLDDEALKIINESMDEARKASQGYFSET